jgi:hypothetical protein
VVRVALEQLPDPGVLVVREAELAVDRLFRDGAQEVILAARLDMTQYPGTVCPGATTVPR